MTLSEDQQRRYARQTILRDIGEAGQEKLLASKVALVGVGGIGAPASLYLAAAGVGTLSLIDHDVVELSNLNRQVLFETSDIGRSKVESAVMALQDLNPDLAYIPHDTKLSEENATDILQNYDLVIDGSDNFATRLLVDHTCETLNIPLLTAAISGFEMHIMQFEGQGKRYRDVYPDLTPEQATANCEESGVLGAVAGMAGSMLAGLAVKQLLAIGEPLLNQMLVLNLDGLEMRKVRL